jgi:hypothetical protein
MSFPGPPNSATHILCCLRCLRRSTSLSSLIFRREFTPEQSLGSTTTLWLRNMYTLYFKLLVSVRDRPKQTWPLPPWYIVNSAEEVVSNRIVKLISSEMWRSCFTHIYSCLFTSQKTCQNRHTTYLREVLTFHFSDYRINFVISTTHLKTPTLSNGMQSIRVEHTTFSWMCRVVMASLFLPR